MIEISSTSNATFKKFLSLKEKKGRNNFHLALLEGEKVVFEAVKAKIVECLICQKDKDFSNLNFEGEVFVVPNFILKKLSSVENNQGVIAVIKTDFVSQFKQNKGNFLVLDGVSDPGNLGSIIRTAAARGFNDIYLIDCVDLFNDKVLRSASGTFFKVNFVKTDYGGMKKLFENSKNFIVCADLDGENLFNFKKPKDKNIGVVLGNEGNGISKNAKKFVNKILTIPMQNDVESLNVSVSAGIIMYQI